MRRLCRSCLRGPPVAGGVGGLGDPATGCPLQPVLPLHSPLLSAGGGRKRCAALAVDGRGCLCLYPVSPVEGRRDYASRGAFGARCLSASTTRGRFGKMARADSSPGVVGGDRKS